MYDFALYYHLAIKPCEFCLSRALRKSNRDYLPDRLARRYEREKNVALKRSLLADRRLCGYGIMSRYRVWDFVFDCPTVKPYLKRPPNEKDLDKHKFVYKRQGKLSITMRLALDALEALAHKRYSVDTRDRIIAMRDCILGVKNPFASEKKYFWGERDISYVGTSNDLELVEGKARMTRSYAKKTKTKPESEEIKPTGGSLACFRTRQGTDRNRLTSLRHLHEKVIKLYDDIDSGKKSRPTVSGGFLYTPSVSNVMEVPHFTFSISDINKFRPYGEWRWEYVEAHYKRVIKKLENEIEYLEKHLEEDEKECMKGLELGKGIVEELIKKKEFKKAFEERNRLVYNRKGIVGIFRNDETKKLKHKELSTRQKKRLVNNTYKLFLKLTREILGVRRTSGKAEAYLATNFYNPLRKSFEIAKAIAKVRKPRDKKVLEEYYHEFRGQSDIAREMKINQATVSRIIANFKLHKQGFEVSKLLHRGKRG